jgi:hypothetical protein
MKSLAILLPEATRLAGLEETVADYACIRQRLESEGFKVAPEE